MTEKILIVENNPDYMKAAERVLSRRPGLSLVKAVDYESAISSIESEEPSLALVDCFIPSQQGMRWRLDRAAISAILIANIGDVRGKQTVEAILHCIDQYGIDMTMKGMIPGRVSADIDQMIQDGSLGKEDENHRYQLGESLLKGYQDLVTHFSDFNNFLATSRANQPLGILVIEELVKKGVPSTLVTSNHHRGILDSLRRYANRTGISFFSGIKLVDGEKANPEYWVEALTHHDASYKNHRK